MAKRLVVLGPILVPLAQIWVPKIFSWTSPLLDVRHSCKLSLYAISRKTNKPNLRKWQKKPSFGPNFDPFSQNSGQKIDYSVSH